MSASCRPVLHSLTSGALEPGGPLQEPKTREQERPDWGGVCSYEGPCVTVGLGGLKGVATNAAAEIT